MFYNNFSSIGNLQRAIAEAEIMEISSLPMRETNMLCRSEQKSRILMKFLKNFCEQDNLFRAVIPWNSARIPIITLSMLIIQVLGIIICIIFPFSSSLAGSAASFAWIKFEYKLNCNRNRQFYHNKSYWLIDWTRIRIVSIKFMAFVQITWILSNFFRQNAKRDRTQSFPKVHGLTLMRSYSGVFPSIFVVHFNLTSFFFFYFLKWKKILKNLFAITIFRCKSFQTTKRDEFCRIPGGTVSPSVPGNPTQIRLPHINANVFRQFILYAYTGKVFVSLSSKIWIWIDWFRLLITLSSLNLFSFLETCGRVHWSGR